MGTTTYEEQKELPFSAAQLFDVVIAIDHYADYLPWCVGSRIVERHEDYLIADLIIGYKFIRERFRSKVYFTRAETVRVEYVEGPLKNLTNLWTFHDNGNGTSRLDFHVAFEFKNPFLRALVDVFFDEIIKRMVKAFEERAEELYNK